MDEFVTSGNIHSIDFLKGALLLVDKPAGWTSFDVVNKLRGALKHILDVKKIKVGHAGTLDPMATGLLLICTGKWTARLSEFQGMHKEYTGEITLGATTASYDAETPEENQQSVSHISGSDVQRAAQTFVGEIEQLPPIYSAIKVDGKPLYLSARKGIDVEVKSRPVTIHAINILEVALPKVNFKVACSKGTYIRSLAHDLGQKLGCGGYLSALRRTRIGEYRVENAWQLDALIQALRDRSGR